ncbi:MAG: hypothetical protein WCI43_00900 [Candidatus Firestonebacteria bacterium]
MSSLRFDFNNMMEHNIGKKDGISTGDLKAFKKQAYAAQRHLAKVLLSKKDRISLSLEWTRLPFQDEKVLAEIQTYGEQIGKNYENVIFLGIGGSYLGLKAAQDALLSPYYNDFKALRKGRARIYFEGNNLDPETLFALLKNLNPKKTFVVCISKSGETTETKAALELAENWLRKAYGKNFAKRIAVITDPESGALRQKAKKANNSDPLAYRSLPLIPGVGGRFSEFNMGLLHLAIIGVKLKEVLAGAAAMAKSCEIPDIFGNPALMYAVLQVLAFKRKRKSIAVLMPFSEQLKATADWYVQLLAESTGKKFGRKIIVEDGVEKWAEDKSRLLNTGRTPVSARGTNDLHSIQQNNIEGRNDKTVTFIRVEKFRNDLRLPFTGDFLAGKKYSELLKTAQEGTAWALNRAERPNCVISLPELSPRAWGELLFFFEMATAYEGELLNINAFNQPGVESYKNFMFFKLKKPGVKKETSEEITNNPMVSKKRYII